MDDQISISQSPDAIYELWTIVAFATLSERFSRYAEALEALQGDAVEASVEARAHAYSTPDNWQADLADCGRVWCERAVFEQGIGRAPDTYEEDTLDTFEGKISRTQSLWDSFKTEFRLLVCTDDKKYKDLRARIAKMTGHKNQLAIMSAVAAEMGVHMGVTVATILVPLCATCFLAAPRTGRTILCDRLARPGFHNFGVKLGIEKPPEHKRPER
jgi:hypothetical protein